MSVASGLQHDERFDSESLIQRLKSVKRSMKKSRKKVKAFMIDGHLIPVDYLDRYRSRAPSPTTPPEPRPEPQSMPLGDQFGKYFKSMEGVDFTPREPHEGMIHMGLGSPPPPLRPTKRGDNHARWECQSPLPRSSASQGLEGEVRALQECGPADPAPAKQLGQGEREEIGMQDPLLSGRAELDSQEFVHRQPEIGREEFLRAEQEKFMRKQAERLELERQEIQRREIERWEAVREEIARRERLDREQEEAERYRHEAELREEEMRREEQRILQQVAMALQGGKLNLQGPMRIERREFEPVHEQHEQFDGQETPESSSSFEPTRYVLRPVKTHTNGKSILNHRDGNAKRHRLQLRQKQAPIARQEVLSRPHAPHLKITTIPRDMRRLQRHTRYGDDTPSEDSSQDEPPKGRNNLPGPSRPFLASKVDDHHLKFDLQLGVDSIAGVVSLLSAGFTLGMAIGRFW